MIRPKFSSRIIAKSKPDIGSHTNLACVTRMRRLKNRKTNGTSKLDLSKRKPADYMELAYREAISKLKYLLAESFVPTAISGTKQRSVQSIYKSSNPRIAESEEDTDDQSMISDNLRRKDLSRNAALNTYPPLSKTIQSSKAYSNVTLSKVDLQSIPPELTSFIERQDDYIEQLERESQYCRDELTNLLSKVREIVAENEMYSKNQVALSKYVLQDYKDHCRVNHECHVQNESDVDNSLKCKQEKYLVGPSIMFESRISELEAQLTQTKLELRKAQEENQAGLKRLSESSSNESNIELKAELDKALRAKYEAEMKLEESQKLLLISRDKETEATKKARRSMDDRQEIEFERNQSEMEIRRLKDELERQYEKLRETIQDANRRITEEKQQVERRYNQQIEQLTADIVSHWETMNKSQLESEKQRREINELRRELSQKQTAIDNLKKELQDKISTLQGDVNQALNEKDAAEQEILTSKLAVERSDRQARQEQSRLQAEINSYKQRLERADADLVHCRRENLRLSEQIASLEKEISISKITRSEENRNEITPRLENEKELTSMVMDMETKHAVTVAGLEDALNNQATIVSKLTAECQSLTQRLEANNLKYKGYSVLTEEVVKKDVTTIGQTASPSSKKRTVKVDLKVKVIPKKKSEKTLSAQEEMAGLQSNIERLSSKIRGSLVSHAEGIAVEANDDNEAFHYNAKMNSIVSHTNGLPTDAPASQMIHQGYDTMSDQQVADEESEMYSNASNRNDQMQGDLYGLSSDQTCTAQNNFAPNVIMKIETAEAYQHQEDARNNEEYTANVPNTEAYMMEHAHDQYDEYDPSQYPEEQYINGNQFNMIADQMENNQTISDAVKAHTETLH